MIKTIKPLKFSEYRIEFAREILEVINEFRGCGGVNPIEFYIVKMYRSYLLVCGFNKKEERIKQEVINYFQYDNIGIFNKTYDPNLLENINANLDKIMEEK